MRGIEVVFIDNDTIIIAFKKGLGLEIFSKVNNYQKKDSRDVVVFFYRLICTRVQMDINEKL